MKAPGQTVAQKAVNACNSGALFAQQRQSLIPFGSPWVQEVMRSKSSFQVLTAFASLVKIDLEHALGSGGGIFGDEGARVKGSARKAKNKAVWNPVTLALGLNDAYRVPLPYLKRAFNAHDFLHPWAAQWNHTLALLGK